MATAQQAEPDVDSHPGAGHRTAATRATAVTVATTLVVLTVVLGYVDGTGLFAPLNWVDTG